MDGTRGDGTAPLDGPTPEPTRVPGGDGLAAAALPAPGVAGDEAAGRCLVVPSLGLPPVDAGPVTTALRERGYDVLPLLADATWARLDAAAVRLSQVVDDCRQALRQWDPTCVVAFGLGASAALRALAVRPSRTSAVLVAPVLDLADALSRGGYGRRRGLAFAISDPADRSLAELYDDAERHGLATPHGSARDALDAAGRLRFVLSLGEQWGGTEPAYSLARSMAATGRPVTVTTVPAHDTGRRTVAAIVGAVSAVHG